MIALFFKLSFMFFSQGFSLDSLDASYVDSANGFAFRYPLGYVVIEDDKTSLPCSRHIVLQTKSEELSIEISLTNSSVQQAAQAYQFKRKGDKWFLEGEEATETSGPGWIELRGEMQDRYLGAIPWTFAMIQTDNGCSATFFTRSDGAIADIHMIISTFKFSK